MVLGPGRVFYTAAVAACPSFLRLQIKVTDEEERQHEPQLWHRREAKGVANFLLPERCD